MNDFKKQEGFTILEIILAIAVLMIFLFAFMTLSTSSIGGIFGAGEKSSALFDAQKRVDREIDDGIDGTLDPVSHTIDFDGLAPFNIDTQKIEIPYDYDGHTGTLYYFYPTPTSE